MRRLSFRTLLILLLGISTCTPSALQVQARLANSIALGGNRTLPLLVDAYRSEGLRIIAQAHESGQSRSVAEQRLAAHTDAWRPVWGDCDENTGQCQGGAWPALRAAHEAWASALEQQISGQPLDLASATQHAQNMQRAYCALRSAVPSPTRDSIPQIPGAPCP